ncbi:MAG: hypothetical protein HXX81_04165 [Campylobacterales bacterium]|nr:hypothetical protein [Campylobacterales bacterium]
MPLFKQAILKTHKQDESLISKRWAKFQEFKSKIEFIKSVKEEKYQTQFLKDIFEECLGFTLDSTNPNSYNLEREKKNETDSKKADGMIYVIASNFCEIKFFIKDMLSYQKFNLFNLQLPMQKVF